MLNVGLREPGTAGKELLRDDLLETELTAESLFEAELEAGAPSRLRRGSRARGAGAASGVELWGGIECTVNRVGDRYFDQMEQGGHARRLSDLDLIASLGIRALRYPVLWERTAPAGPASADWSWSDERLERLRALSVRPIVGLVHHGSGPRHTSLLDPAFPGLLAEYARAVAERYPWVDAYTPVNEIVTTARFSALYGHWYPHAADAQSFGWAIVHQCRATILAMRAIREVNPRARLVQTDDLGKTFSVPGLASQAAFDNERRWLGWDLLCGRLQPGDTLWKYLVGTGLPEAELEWFRDNPCPPDLLGINYYITSERWLDDRLEHYPEWTHGGNGRHRYADVERVRVCSRGIAGPGSLMREAWERYGLPMAITEAHLGCTREEQLRWLLYVWNAARGLAREGLPVRAVTAWSLLGAYDWNSLLTRWEGHYEPGVFDLRGGEPRPTALAPLLRELAAGEEPAHPLLRVPGWWERPERLLYPAVDVETCREARSPALPAKPRRSVTPPRPLLITGATGTLGRAFARLCEVRGIPYRLLGRREMDITAPFMVEDVLEALQPWAVVNAAGYVRADDNERDPARCVRDNADGPAVLAAVCARLGLPLVTFSSDQVFDGLKGAPYLESDPVAPLDGYGRSKAEAEARVLQAHPGTLVVRSSAFFCPWDGDHFVSAALREIAAGRPFRAVTDVVVSPTYVPDLVHATLDLLIDGAAGVWHLSNQGHLTWADLARTVADMAGLDPDRVEGHSSPRAGVPAPRRRFRALGSERGLLLPPLEEALERYLRHRVTPAEGCLTRSAA